jgi:hypothetical protein
VRQMGRGHRDGGHHRREGFPGKDVRGINDERWDPVDPDLDPFRELMGEEENFPNPANDDYIWPMTEEEEDD